MIANLKTYQIVGLNIDLKPFKIKLINMRKIIFSALIAPALILSLESCTKPTPAPEPYGVLPSQAQLDWQDMQYYMFVHFGPNTFTNVEWGDGKEDPKVFNPTNIDVKQWAKVAKDAGMKGIILTSKHHDGFCLWPSEYSTHTVRESGWKNGEGDLLKELSEAAREQGLKFGVYLSPWDQNHPKYGTDEYNEVFTNTLEEVMTNYGDIFEIWFDGANGEGHEGKKQVYDFNLFHKTVYDNQPNTIIFSDIGPGSRWMGNERGIAGETNWSRLDTVGFGRGHNAPASDTLNKGNIYGEAWIPAETDVSIRPGWFYSKSTDSKVKSVDDLAKIHLTSIGRNSNLLLNVPPDRTGRINPIDSARLMEFKAFIDKSYEKNLMKGATISASNTRGNESKYSASNLLDGKANTYWATEDGITKASILIKFKNPTKLNRIWLKEYIPLGQRIAKFDVKYLDEKDGVWKIATEGTTIGANRILDFPIISTKEIKITITESLASIVLNGVEAYLAPEFVTTPTIVRDADGTVTITNQNTESKIYFTQDGTTPTENSQEYTGSFKMDKVDSEGRGQIRAITVMKSENDNNINSINRKSIEIVKDFDVLPTKWAFPKNDKEQTSLIIDGDPATIGTFNFDTPIEIEFGKELKLVGFVYAPQQNVDAPNVYQYEVQGLIKGQWVNIASGSFQNIKNNPITQTVKFTTDKQKLYSAFRFIPKELVDKSDVYTVGELSVLSK